MGRGPPCGGPHPIVATLARQDGTRPGIWNDFKKVRQACRDVEERFGLTGTAPADRTAARRPARSETEQAARRGWAEPPRVTLRREVSTAAAGAHTEQEFFARLAESGVVIRQRYGVDQPGGGDRIAVGLPATPRRTAGRSGTAAGSSRPTSPCRNCGGAGPHAARIVSRAQAVRGSGRAPCSGQGHHGGGPGTRRGRVLRPARADGVLVRLRFSDPNPRGLRLFGRPGGSRRR